MDYCDLFYEEYGRLPYSQDELEQFIRWYNRNYTPARRRGSGQTNMPMIVIVSVIALMLLLLANQNGFLSPPATRETPIPNAVQIVTATYTPSPTIAIPANAPVILPTDTPHPEPGTPAQGTHCQLGSDLQPLTDCQ